MRTPLSIRFCLCVAVFLPFGAIAQQQETNSPMRLLGAAITRLARVIQPSTNEPPQTFTASLHVLKAEGLPKELVGQQLALAFQAPDHLRLSANYRGQQFTICRAGQELWIYE